MPSMNIELRAAFSQSRDTAPGRVLFEQLLSVLERAGWNCAEPENWRDSGCRASISLCSQGLAAGLNELNGIRASSWRWDGRPNDAGETTPSLRH